MSVFEKMESWLEDQERIASQAFALNDQPKDNGRIEAFGEALEFLRSMVSESEEEALILYGFKNAERDVYPMLSAQLKYVGSGELAGKSIYAGSGGLSEESKRILRSGKQGNEVTIDEVTLKRDLRRIANWRKAHPNDQKFLAKVDSMERVVMKKLKALGVTV